MHLIDVLWIMLPLFICAVQFGQSGTIYDAAPVRSFTFKVTDPDLNEDLGAGFQAAHIWVNNLSNQSLFLPDAPDVVPAGMTRVVAIRRSDHARASWSIPPAFAITQPAAPLGAAILIFLNAGIEIAPHPGVPNTPVGVNLPWKLVGTKTTTGSGADQIITSAVDPGTQSLGIAISGNFQQGLQPPSVTGVQSNTLYLPTSLNPATRTAGWLVIPVNGALDSTYKINWGAATAAGIVVSVYASGLTPGYPALSQNFMADSLPVVIAIDQTPAIWQAPNRIPISRVGGGSLIPAVAGQTVYGFGGGVRIYIAAAGGSVIISGGNGDQLVSVASDTTSWAPFQLNGAALGAVGTGVSQTVNGGAGGQVHMAFSQG